MRKNYIIFGASQGLGDAFVKGLPSSGDTVWIVSRSEPSSLNIDDGVRRIWLKIDLSSQTQYPFYARSIGEQGH